MALATEQARRHWIDALEQGPDLHEIVDDLPGERMSNAAKRFAAALYVENLTSLSHPLRTMGT